MRCTNSSQKYLHGVDNSFIRKGALRRGVLWPPTHRHCCQGCHRLECWHSGQDIFMNMREGRNSPVFGLKSDNTEHGDCNICACPSPPHSLWSFQELYESYLRNSWKAANPWTTSHKVCGTCYFNRSLEIYLSSCRIFKTKDDITIKISDRGGGMSRRVRRKIFNYMYSTAPKVVEWTH